MNVIALIGEYQRWINKLMFTSVQNTKVLQKLEEERAHIQASLLLSLFNEIPSLSEFKVSRLWGNATLVSVNNTPAVMKTNTLSDAYKSWLIETNLKSSEVDLLLKSVIVFTPFNHHSAKEIYFKREDFLK